MAKCTFKRMKSAFVSKHIAQSLRDANRYVQATLLCDVEARTLNKKLEKKTEWQILLADDSQPTFTNSLIAKYS